MNHSNSMPFSIDIQNASHQRLPVTHQQLREWVSQALDGIIPCAELTLRFVDSAEMLYLNHTYRKKNSTTNVLSFPSEIPETVQLEHPFLGDVIICPDVLNEERKQFFRPKKAHWAHILIHGVLHLVGYDHIQPEDEVIMQAREIEVLAHLGFNNPYHFEGAFIDD